MAKKEMEITDADLAFLDSLAALTLAGDTAFARLRSVYEKDPCVHMPADLPPEMR